MSFRPHTPSTNECVNAARLADVALIPRTCPTCGLSATCSFGVPDPLRPGSIEAAEQSRREQLRQWGEILWGYGSHGCCAEGAD